MIRKVALSIPLDSIPRSSDGMAASRGADGPGHETVVNADMSASRDMYLRRKEAKWTQMSKGVDLDMQQPDEIRYPRLGVISTQFFTPGKKSISDQGLAAAQQFYKHASPWGAQPPIHYDSTTTDSGCRFHIRKNEKKKG